MEAIIKKIAKFNRKDRGPVNFRGKVYTDHAGIFGHSNGHTTAYLSSELISNVVASVPIAEAIDTNGVFEQQRLINEQIVRALPEYADGIEAYLDSFFSSIPVDEMPLYFSDMDGEDGLWTVSIDAIRNSELSNRLQQPLTGSKKPMVEVIALEDDEVITAFAFYAGSGDRPVFETASSEVWQYLMKDTSHYSEFTAYYDWYFLGITEDLLGFDLRDISLSIWLGNQLRLSEDAISTPGLIRAFAGDFAEVDFENTFNRIAIRDGHDIVGNALVSMFGYYIKGINQYRETIDGSDLLQDRQTFEDDLFTPTGTPVISVPCSLDKPESLEACNAKPGFRTERVKVGDTHHHYGGSNKVRNVDAGLIAD